MKTPRPLRDDAGLVSVSFERTEETSTLATFLEALKSPDHEAILRGWGRRNRRHPLEVR
jgi:hypothetical protein